MAKKEQKGVIHSQNPGQSAVVSEVSDLDSYQETFRPRNEQRTGQSEPDGFPEMFVAEKSTNYSDNLEIVETHPKIVEANKDQKSVEVSSSQGQEAEHTKEFSVEELEKQRDSFMEEPKKAKKATKFAEDTKGYKRIFIVMDDPRYIQIVPDYPNRTKNLMGLGNLGNSCYMYLSTYLAIQPSSASIPQSLSENYC